MRFTKQEGIRDCGICCMQNIIRYYGGFLNTEKLRKLTNTDENGTSIYNIIRVSNDIGFESKAYKCDINDLNNLSFPLIAFIKLDIYNHYVILEKIDIDKIYIFDPIRGRIVYTLDEFMNVWQKVIITFDKKGKIVKEIDHYNDYLKEIYKNNKKVMITIAIMALISSLLGLISSSFVKKIFDNKIKNGLFILFIFLLLIKSFIDYFKNRISIKLNNKIDYTLFSKVCEKVFSLPISYHHNRPTGDFVSRINDLYSIEDFTSYLLLSTIVDFLFILYILFVILFLSFRIFIIILFVSTLYTLICFYMKEKESNLLTDLKNKFSNCNSSIVDYLFGINTVKNLSIEDKIINKQNMIKKEYLNSNNKTLSFISIQSLILSLIESYGFLIVLFVGYSLVRNKGISIGELSFIYTLYIYYMSSLKNVINLYKKYLSSKLSYKRINNILKIEEDNKVLKNIKTIDSINFKDISYSYGDNKVLNKFNLKINRGDFLFVEGESGKGKSTIFKLLNKELSLKKGNIYINNMNINEIDDSSLKNNICYVSQEEYLFNDTIKNNILMYKNVKTKELNQVIKATYIDKMLKKRNISLDYILEENGHNLSGGERQLILIARALLRKTDYIIFDETTNEIDVNTEKKILENIKTEYNKTIVLISHRSSSIDLFTKRVKV